MKKDERNIYGKMFKGWGRSRDWFIVFFTDDAHKKKRVSGLFLFVDGNVQFLNVSIVFLLDFIDDFLEVR